MSEEVMSADSLLRENARLSRMVGEQNTTIGYQDAMLAHLRSALEQIEAHHVEQNRRKGRDESHSTTLRIARAALATTTKATNE